MSAKWDLGDCPGQSGTFQFGIFGMLIIHDVIGSTFSALIV
jgi:hypothetical protein